MTAAAASSSSTTTKVQHVAQGDGLVIASGGTLNVESGGALQIGGVDLTASLASKGNDAARYVAAGATKTLTVAANNNQTVRLDTVGGSVVTLPAATGSGAKFKFLVTVLATSASHKIQVANASDFMIGVINGTRIDSGNAVLGFAAANSGTVATNSDTITLNRTTTGSVSVGEWIDVEDVAANTWAVNGLLSATGAAFATPFTAAV